MLLLRAWLAACLLAVGAFAAAQADEVLWPSEPRRVDRDSQTFERLPDLVPPPPPAAEIARFRLDGFVRIHDSVSFTHDGRRYRLAGVDPLPNNAICEGEGGARRACGVQARAVFGQMMNGFGVSCRPAPDEEDVEEEAETLVACERNGADIGDLLLRQGFALPARE